MKLVAVASLLISFTAAAHVSAPPAATADAPDLAMYARIRDEGFSRSRVMDYASALFDDIGPRLTGSPNLAKANRWTVEQFKAMGCAEARLESWGDFGMGWRQRNASVAMTSPDTAVLIAQATPWSPPTKGVAHGSVIAVARINKAEDFDKWKGKLAGKIILYGRAPEIEPDPKPMLEHFDENALKAIASFPPDLDFSQQHIKPLSAKEWADAFENINFQEKVSRFFADEGALAILRSSYAEDGGILRDDNNEGMGNFVYLPDHRQALTSVVLANEGYHRLARLLAADVPVTLDVDVRTEFTGDHEQGYNVLAEIPGSDPALKSQVVMAGAHLDSWTAGTGATDDGAGVIITMEAMRILTALHVHPRRTIRAALWAGEEEGELGSLAYVRAHYGTVGYSTTPEQQQVPQFLREKVGPVTPGKEYGKLSAYFNLDNGGGKLLGIYASGNAEAAAIFSRWIAPLADLGVTTVSLRPSGSSDQDSFNDVGLPGFQFIQDPRDYDTRSAHTNEDTYERLSAGDLKQAAVVEAIFLYNAAMREEAFPRVTMPEYGKAAQSGAVNLMPDREAAKKDAKAK